MNITTEEPTGYSAIPEPASLTPGTIRIYSSYALAEWQRGQRQEQPAFIFRVTCSQADAERMADALRQVFPETVSISYFRRARWAWQFQVCEVHDADR